MSAINRVVFKPFSSMCTDQEATNLILNLINEGSPIETRIDIARLAISHIKSSDLAQYLYSNICNAYLKLQTASGCEKAYEVAKFKEQDHKEIYQIYTSIIIESCERIKTTRSMKLAKVIYNENSDWLKHLYATDMSHPSNQISQNPHVLFHPVEKVKDISQLSEKAIKEFIFRLIQSDEADELNEYFLSLDSVQKWKLFSSYMKYKSDWTGWFEYINPLQYACLLGNIEVVKVMLKHGAPVNDAESIYNPATQRGSLHFALDEGHTHVALLLLEKGAMDSLAFCSDVHAHKAYKLPAESNHVAFPEPRTGIIDYNLPANYKPSFSYISGLHIAIVKNMPEVVEKLLTVGKADIAQRAGGYTSCLHLAAREGHEALVKLLLAHGAKVVLDSEDYHGNTPKDMAIAAKHENLLKLLTP